MTLTFDTHSTSLTHLVQAILRPKAAIVSKKKKIFSLFPIQKPMSPNLTLA